MEAFSLVEEWRPVPGHEVSHEVSNLGRVRSLDRFEHYKRVDQYSGRTLTVRRCHKGRMLRPGRMKSGHLSVAMVRGQSSLVHHLVLFAFVGPMPDGMESLHRDGKPANNHLSNLHWGTRSENLLDAVTHGSRPIGSRAWNAKLTEADIPQIRRALQNSARGVLASIARQYGVSWATIRQIRDGRCWKHVGEIGC